MLAALIFFTLLTGVFIGATATCAIALHLERKSSRAFRSKHAAALALMQLDGLSYQEAMLQVQSEPLD